MSASTSMPARRQVVFILDNLPDWQMLAAAFSQDADPVLLKAEADVISQMVDALTNRHDLTAIHLFSHGSAGVLQLGSTTLDRHTLETRASDWARIGQALADDGDLLLYGCNVAEDADGKAFVDAVARMTDADVAASEDKTGAEVLGGDWALEYQTGLIATAALLPAYDHTLATITVDTITDTATINAADGTSFSEALLSAAAGDSVAVSSSLNGATNSATINLAANFTFSQNLTLLSQKTTQFFLDNPAADRLITINAGVDLRALPGVALSGWFR